MTAQVTSTPLTIYITHFQGLNAPSLLFCLPHAQFEIWQLMLVQNHISLWAKLYALLHTFQCPLSICASLLFLLYFWNGKLSHVYIIPCIHTSKVLKQRLTFYIRIDFISILYQPFSIRIEVLAEILLRVDFLMYIEMTSSCFPRWSRTSFRLNFILEEETFMESLCRCPP